MPNAPSTYASSPELAFKRMQVVLKRMVKCRVLTSSRPMPLPQMLKT